MKKMLVLLLAVVMCFSLVACGGGETPSTDDNSAQAQQAQNGNDEPEFTAPDVSKPDSTETEITEPENTEPQYETITLTLENWNEYFEITNEVHFCKNEFDEIWRIDNNFYLKLKPEYEKRCLGSDDEFAIKIEWTETTSVDAIINYEDETCELLEEPSATDGNKTRYAQVLDNVGNFKTSFFQEPKSSERPGYFMHYPHDFEVTKIKGLLYIAVDSK